MHTLAGTRDGAGLKIAIAAARWNWFVGEKLVAGAVDALRRCGLADGDVTLAHAPGSYELPLLAKALAETGRYHAVVALGVVVRGDTAHFDHVAGQAASGLMKAGLDTGVPVIFGVLTTDTMEQAIDRAGGKAGNKGAEAAETAIEMATLLRAVRAG